MELWDIYDINRNKTDRTMIRGNAFRAGDYHLVVHICIFNSKGEMLIQQRQSCKLDWPDMWDMSVGGSAVSGESSQSAAEREVLEELGIHINLQEVRPKLTINFERGFDDVYLVEKDIALEELKLRTEEVKTAKWASKEEIIQMIEKGEFIPFYSSLITLLFDIRKQYGCHNKNIKSN